VLQWCAAVRSETDVEHHRDVISERRLKDVDGSLLVSEEAVDVRPASKLEVIVDSDLHCVALALYTERKEGGVSPQPPQGGIYKCASSIARKVSLLDMSPQRKS